MSKERKIRRGMRVMEGTRELMGKVGGERAKRERERARGNAKGTKEKARRPKMRGEENEKAKREQRGKAKGMERKRGKAKVEKLTSSRQINDESHPLGRSRSSPSSRKTSLGLLAFPSRCDVSSTEAKTCDVVMLRHGVEAGFRGI